MPLLAALILSVLVASWLGDDDGFDVGVVVGPIEGLDGSDGVEAISQVARVLVNDIAKGTSCRARFVTRDPDAHELPHMGFDHEEIVDSESVDLAELAAVVRISDLETEVVGGPGYLIPGRSELSGFGEVSSAGAQSRGRWVVERGEPPEAFDAGEVEELPEFPEEVQTQTPGLPVSGLGGSVVSVAYEMVSPVIEALVAHRICTCRSEPRSEGGGVSDKNPCAREWE